MRSSLHKSDKCYFTVWGKLNSWRKRVYTSSGESMKIWFVSEQFRVRAKNCESYGLWSSCGKQPGVLCLMCMLGALPTAKLHQCALNDLGCRNTISTNSKKKKKRRRVKGTVTETLEQQQNCHFQSIRMLFLIVLCSIWQAAYPPPTSTTWASGTCYDADPLAAVLCISLSGRRGGLRASLSGFLMGLNHPSNPLWGSCAAYMSLPVDLWLMLNVSSALTFS